MRIAILGATSQIAKDLIVSFAAFSNHELTLFARKPETVSRWLNSINLIDLYTIKDFEAFNFDDDYDAILNFIGVGNPAAAMAMGNSIFDVTLKYDDLALNYVKQHPSCRYIFLSSGAAYGENFYTPVKIDSMAVIPINNLQPQDWYSVAKLHAECRHRALHHLPITDVRVFNYFSHTQDMNARFFITDIMRAIRTKTILQTSDEPIVRDFIHPSDFFSLIGKILNSPKINVAVDCYSKAPVEKHVLLSAMQETFDLRYEIIQSAETINATGNKTYYFSNNVRAADFGYKPTLTSLEAVMQEATLVCCS
jgi:nucleoside-diphosphate-sugar epimerase